MLVVGPICTVRQKILLTEQQVQYRCRERGGNSGAVSRWDGVPLPPPKKYVL